MVKKIYESISKLLTDEKAFNETIDKIYDGLQKAKGGKFNIKDMEKGLHEAAEKTGEKTV